MLASTHVRTPDKTLSAMDDKTKPKTRLEGKNSESEGFSRRETSGFVACRLGADLG
jgi:hypothetical protein